MSYLTAKQFSEKWGISERRIIKLCQDERISGAIKNGMVWLLPEDTLKPSDKRSKMSKYINTQKRVMLVNTDNLISDYLIDLLKKEGYLVDIINMENVKINKYKNELQKILEKTENYYDGLIFIDIWKKGKISIENKEFFIKEIAQKMNSESSIVLVNNLRNEKDGLEKKLYNSLESKIGVRINSININVPLESNILVDNEEIAQDILTLFIKFKNTTGISINTNGGAIKFDKNEHTKNLEIGKFYKVLDYYFKNLNKESYMWCVSTMLEDEWTEEPLEMHFRTINIDAANRGANIERIFMFPSTKIKEFKNNKTLKFYMQSNIKTLYVDYYEILEKAPELLKIVENGWDGIDKDTLLVDLPAGNKKRGYVSRNKKEVRKAYECFEKLKKYARDLREILK